MNVTKVQKRKISSRLCLLAGDLFQNSSLLHSIPSKASEQLISTSAILDVNYYLKLGSHNTLISELAASLTLQGVPKKGFNRTLLEPRCTGSITSSRHPLGMENVFCSFFTKGRVRPPNRMSFRKNSKRPLTPAPPLLLALFDTFWKFIFSLNLA